MDHKKAVDIEFGGKYYAAEFNDATFNGDVSALTGTFNGSLTVGSLDNVRNINIGYGSIGKSGYFEKSRAPESGYFPEGKEGTIIEFTFVADEDGFALMESKWEGKNGDNDSSQYSFTSRFRVYVNDVLKFNSHGFSLGIFYSYPQYVSLGILIPLVKGTNQIRYVWYTNYADTTPYGYCKDVKVSITAIRK